MSTPETIVTRLVAHQADGLTPWVVRASRSATDTWRVEIVFRDLIPLGEGGAPVLSRDPPPGVTVYGVERWPSDVFTVHASQEGIEALMRDAAAHLGHAYVDRIDATGYRDAAAHGYPHYRTVPA